MQVKHYQAVECSVVVYCRIVGAVNAPSHHEGGGINSIPYIQYNKKKEKINARAEGTDVGKLEEGDEESDVSVESLGKVKTIGRGWKSIGEEGRG